MVKSISIITLLYNRYAVIYNILILNTCGKILPQTRSRFYSFPVPKSDFPSLARRFAQTLNNKAIFALGKVIATSLTICYQESAIGCEEVIPRSDFKLLDFQVASAQDTEPMPPYFVVLNEPIIKPLNVVIG